MKVEYLHSWDTSYIAAATCDLYAMNKDTKELVHLIDSISIVPNKYGHETVTGTYPRPHYLKIRSDSEFLKEATDESMSLLSVECRSKELGKLACIGAIGLSIKVPSH